MICWCEVILLMKWQSLMVRWCVLSTELSSPRSLSSSRSSYGLPSPFSSSAMKPASSSCVDNPSPPPPPSSSSSSSSSSVSATVTCLPASSQPLLPSSAAKDAAKQLTGDRQVIDMYQQNVVSVMVDVGGWSPK